MKLKYFIVTTRKNLGSTKIIYPEKYDEILRITKDSLYFTDEKDNKFKRLHIVPAEHSKGVLRQNVIEVTEEEAKKISKKEEDKVTVTNDAVVRIIEIKSRLRRKLTEKEEKALDPEDPEPGFGRSETLADKIEKHKKE